jgi:tRNA A37 threonylcarbamoyladenosine synthetase subunit TsaC/SUA5/YrdC
MILKLTSENIAEAINTAISILKKGGIIAYPTETF